MILSRRDFLKLTGITLAAFYLGIPETDAYPHFDPKYQYGDYVVLSSDTPEAFAEARQLLEEQIRLSVPPRYRKDIVWIKHQGYSSDDPLDQQHYLAWKTTPK